VALDVDPDYVEALGGLAELFHAPKRDTIHSLMRREIVDLVKTVKADSGPVAANRLASPISAWCNFLVPVRLHHAIDPLHVDRHCTALFASLSP
jgi:hypothetical protein